MTVDSGTVPADVPTEVVAYRDLVAGDVIVTDERFDGTRGAQVVTEIELESNTLDGGQEPYIAGATPVLRVKQP